LRGSVSLIALTAALLGWPGTAPTVLAQPASPSSEGRAADPGQSSRAELPGEVIILNGPTDFSELLQKLKQPDLIVIKPADSTTAPPSANSSRPASTAPSHAVSAVKVRGKLEEDLARLAVDIDLTLLAPGSDWVPLGLDGPIVTSAREGERELEVRTVERGRWAVRLEGAGPHALHVDLSIPIRINPDRKRLELGIPLAASTYLEFDLPGRVQDVDLGTGEPVGSAPLAGGKGTRLSAHLTPRSRLALEWSDESSAPAAQAPLLAAQVEFAIHADAEAITTRSSWEIRGIRGTVRQLQIRLDEQEVVRALQLGDQYLVGEIEKNVLTIPLAEPMRPRTTRQLTLETRRPLPAGPRRNLTLAGMPLAHAVGQSGAIGVTHAADLWVNVAAAQGLERIDPRDLPSKLAARPGTTIAFRFLDPQFRLGLSVEEAPPLYRASSRTNLVLDDDTARSQTSIEVERIRGRLFAVDVTVPAGVEFLTAGPPELIQSQSARKATQNGAAEAHTGPPAQVLTLQLTPLARDQKTFVLSLASRQRIGQEQDLRLGLLAPAGGMAGTSVVSLFARRNATFEPEKGSGPGDDGGTSEFRMLPTATPAADGAGTGERVADAVFSSDQRPSWLRGRLIRHPRTISYETTVSAQVFAGRVEVRQDTALQVRNGSVRSLSVRAPFARAELWDVQGKEYARREEIGPADKDREYRLHFDPPITDRSLLTFRFRLPLEPALSAAAEARNQIPWIRIDDAATGSTTLLLTATPGIKAVAEEAAWGGTGAEWENQAGSGLTQRYRLLRPGGEGERAGLPFTARLLEQVPMPPVVAPRALLRTVVGPARDSRTHAWYWLDSHGSELPFRLPAGARLVRARIDGRATDQLESGTANESYRLILPGESKSKPVLVELVYQVPAAEAGPVWSPPMLEEGAVVLQTLWLVQIPASQTLVGTPTGWADENEWYWDIYVWKRRPWRSVARLAAWLTGSPAQSVNVDEVLGEEPDDSHGFLFGRSDGPGPLRPTLASRAWVVALCSGTVLLLGFFVMFSRVRFRIVWMVIAALGVLAAALAQPSVLLLVAQSAVSGVILTLLGLLIQRLIGRDRAWIRPLESSMHTPRPASDGAPAATPAGVGSDDSTAVRVRRPSSTVDYVASPVSLAPEHEPSGGSRTGPTV
jgi:hypothetical protein